MSYKHMQSMVPACGGRRSKKHEWEDKKDHRGGGRHGGWGGDDSHCNGWQGRESKKCD